MNKKEISPKGATELLQLAVHQLLDAHNYYYNNNWNSIGITVAESKLRSQLPVIIQITNGFKKLLKESPRELYQVQRPIEQSFIGTKKCQIIPKISNKAPLTNNININLNINKNTFLSKKRDNEDRECVMLSKSEYFKYTKIEEFYYDLLTKDYASYIKYLIEENYIKNENNNNIILQKNSNDMLNSISSMQEWSKGVFIYCDTFIQNVNQRIQSECFLGEKIQEIHYFFTKKMKEVSMSQEWMMDYDDFEIEGKLFSQIPGDKFITKYKENIFKLLTTVGNFNSPIVYADDCKSINNSSYIQRGNKRQKLI